MTAFGPRTTIASARASWLPVEKLKPGDVVYGWDFAMGCLAKRVVRRAEWTAPQPVATVSSSSTVLCSTSTMVWCGLRGEYMLPVAWVIALLHRSGHHTFGHVARCVASGETPLVKIELEIGENVFVGDVLFRV